MLPIRFLAVALAMFFVGGCGNSVVEAPQTQTVVLGVGEGVQTTDGNLGIRFVEVTDDSRCATDVVCVWAGNGQVAIRLEPVNGSPVDEELNTNQAVGPREILFSGYTLELVSLSPLPLSTSQIPPGDYEIILRITAE